MNEANPTSGGFRIPDFGKKSGLTAIRSKDANILVRCLNALGRMTVAKGRENAFVYGEGNVQLTLKNLSEGGASGSLTVTETDAAPSVADVTEIRFPDGTVTEIAAGIVEIAVATGTAPAKMYHLKSIQGDYLTCRTWDGSTEGGTDIYIAKNMKLRNSITAALIDGVFAVTYSYPSTVTRISTISGVDQDEVVVPRYLVDDLIFAAETVDGTEVSGKSLIDMNVDGRAWCRKTP